MRSAARAVLVGGTLLVSGLLMVGCVVSDLDLSGRRCPCVEGWECDEDRDLCVPIAGADASAIDASGVDGGVRRDSGPRDAGGSDASGVDADTDAGGGSDAGGGVDAGEGIDAGGGSDAGGGDAGPTGPCDGLHFCDGFETGLTPWGGVDAPAGSTVEVVSTPVHSGSSALRAHAGPDSVVVGVWADAVPFPLPPDVWYRAFYLLPTGAPLPLEVHTMGADATGPIAIYLGGPDDLNFHSHGYAGNASASFSRPLTPDTWVCLEMHVGFDDTDGIIEVYWDGALVAVTPTINTLDPRGLTSIGAGIMWKVFEEEGQEVFVDDVAVHTSRIGCARF